MAVYNEHNKGKSLNISKVIFTSTSKIIIKTSGLDNTVKPKDLLKSQSLIWYTAYLCIWRGKVETSCLECNDSLSDSWRKIAGLITALALQHCDHVFLYCHNVFFFFFSFQPKCYLKKFSANGEVYFDLYGCPVYLQEETGFLYIPQKSSKICAISSIWNYLVEKIILEICCEVVTRRIL